MTSRALGWLVCVAILGCSEGPPPDLSPLPAAIVPLDRCLADARAGAEPPPRLSETGCFEQLRPLSPSAELLPFAVASPLFTDGAGKARWLGLPEGGKVMVDEDGAWRFPEGSVLVKLFTMSDTVDGEASPLETRFMIRGSAGWRFYTYRWNEDGEDARLLEDEEHARLVYEDPDAPDGEQVVDYLFPSRRACAACHSGGVIGPSTEQLGRTVRYGDAPPTQQLDALTDLGVFDPPPIDDAERMPSPSDPDAPLEARARAYLHANCAHCHRPGGFSSSGLDLDLRWSTPLADTRALCVPTRFPSVAGYGMRVAPGDPDASVIVRRMEAMPGEFPSLMPPIGRSIVDAEGVAVVRAWIEQMETSCP